ncbi:oligosaccharide flippase family protein [Rhodococcoides corynebacterioides]|uniref:oligosaccharide flippase family protein n=1 Tax=Rhodococcoides corynebacterioides TaxID=53972 RepID=UPI001C9B3569|nr:oligosaccharide flippase family protein [Rhodococcus corynebacterioides]MBY6361524.1 oligosaccharide flippase family protein [Rhodococcus corynebacterioides]
MTSSPAPDGAVRRSATLTILGQGAKLVLLLVNLVVLGRLLTPEEFGIVTVAVAVVGVAELLRDFGLSAAAIQAHSLSDDEQANLFWVSVALGLALMSLVLAVAYPLEFLIGIEGLGSVTIGLAGVFLLNALQTQFQARLTRAQRFGAVAASDVGGQLVGFTVAVLLALAGAGAWSIVGLQLCASAFVLSSRIALSRWNPGLYRRGVSIRRFLSFGLFLGLSQMLSYVVNSLPSLLIGRMAGAGPAGNFGRAWQVFSIPNNQIFSPLTNVVIVYLTAASRSSRYGSFSRVLVRVVGIFGAAAGSFLLCFSEDVVSLLLGSQWQLASDFLEVLACSLPVQALSVVYFWHFICLDRTRSLLFYNLFSKGALVVGLVVSAWFSPIVLVTVLSIGWWLSWLVCGLWFRDEPLVSVRDMNFVGLGVCVLTFVPAVVLEFPVLEITQGSDVLRVVLWGGIFAATLLLSGLWRPVVALGVLRNKNI